MEKGISPPHRSVIQLFREYTNKCHYCVNDSPSGQISFGFQAKTLSVTDYQQLLDLGWRRTGSWLYHPSNQKSCCPNYTIRLDVKKFTPSKSQKKARNKWKKFIKGYSVKPNTEMDIDIDDSYRLRSSLDNKSSTTIGRRLQKEIEQVMQSAVALALADISTEFVKTSKKHKLKAEISSLLHKKRRGEYREYNLTCNFCLRFRRYAPPGYEPMVLARKIISHLPYHWKAKADAPGFINFIRPKNSKRYKPDDESNDIKMKEDQCPEKEKREFEITMEECCYSDEKYRLFKLYQTEIHNEEESEISVDSFVTSLCTSPLTDEKKTSEIQPTSLLNPGFGSFHQLYRLEGKLFAVGVVDILPNCVLSALQEIEWVKHFVKANPTSSLHYYYMGFYVHNCPKMKYKKSYQPSDLLCPITNQWTPLQQISPHILEKRKCTVLHNTNSIPQGNCISSVQEARSIMERLHFRIEETSVSFCWKGTEIWFRLLEHKPNEWRLLHENATNELTALIQENFIPFVELVGEAFATRFVYLLTLHV